LRGIFGAKLKIIVAVSLSFLVQDALIFYFADKILIHKKIAVCVFLILQGTFHHNPAIICKICC
jgi:hypothetical protein